MSTKHRLKTALKILAGTIFALLSLLTLTCLSLVVWIMLSPASFLSMLQSQLLPETMQIGWKDVRFDVTAPQWCHPRVDFTLKGLSVRAPRIDVPDVDIFLEARLSFFSSNPLLEIPQLRLDSKAPIRMKLSTEPKPDHENSFYESFDTFYSHLESLREYALLEQLSIRVPQLELELSDHQRLELNDVSLARAALGEVLHFSSEARLLNFMTSDGNSVWTAVADASTAMTLDMDALGGGPDQAFVVGHLKLKMPQAEALNDFKIHAKAGRARLDLISSFQQPDPKLGIGGRIELAVDLTEKELSAQAQARLTRMPCLWMKFESLKGTFTIPQDKGVRWSSRASNFEMSAPLTDFFADQRLRPALEKVCACKLPELLTVKVSGSAWLKALLEKNATEKNFVKVLGLEVELDSVSNKFMTADLRGALAVEKMQAQYRYLPTLNGSITIRSFRSLQEILNSQGLMVPAPLDVLEGELALRLQGAVQYSAAETVLPAELEIDLKSENQSAKAKVLSTVKLRKDLKSVDMDVKALVQELWLQLPPLDPLGGVPRIAKDSRILLEPKAAPKKNKKSKKLFTLSVDVETLNPGAIRLLSKYAKPYVPLSLKVLTEPGKDVTGFIQLEPFSVTYLRRTVNLENLRLGLTAIKQGQEGEFPIEGRMRVDQTDYRVFIDVKGTTKRPQVVLTSEPSLTPNEIISVLLYDRTTDQLVSGDAETAGSVQAAMADRAIGLFGLWAFATTPIRSFFYNPVTKTYTATLQVAEGLTAGIGTNWEQTTNLELRKRVSRQWVLTAAWAPGESEAAQGKLVLQWEKRF